MIPVWLFRPIYYNEQIPFYVFAGVSFVAPHINNLYFLSLCRRYGVYSVIRLLFVIKLALSIIMMMAGPNHTWLLCFFIARWGVSYIPAEQTSLSHTILPCIHKPLFSPLCVRMLLLIKSQHHTSFKIVENFQILLFRFDSNFSLFQQSSVHRRHMQITESGHQWLGRWGLRVTSQAAGSISTDVWYGSTSVKT